MAQTAISSSQEDYLEAISEIIEKNGHAHTKDVATALDVSMPSVSAALQQLAARGLVRYQKHQPVTLTEYGEELAQQVRRRHSIMLKFFQDILMLPAKDANETACELEHTLDDTCLNRFAFLAKEIQTRDDCQALRANLQEQMPTIKVKKEAPVIPLNYLPIGQQGIVVAINESLACLQKFADMGIVHGMTVTMESHAPFGDLLRIRLLESSLSIRGEDASGIWVRLVQ
ncbi:MAG: metal-dependent transcriptional regulator [Victivallales bacterium]|jgi:DtxR family Mn-dependent transcriptional regulator|nr:metal-dependent transcriptional regulator [Victivallales bacterium]